MELQDSEVSDSSARPNPQFLRDAHYITYVRMFIRAQNLKTSYLKLLIQLAAFVGENVSLGITLLAGVYIHTNDSTESVIAVSLFWATALFTVLVNFVNELKTGTHGGKNWKRILLQECKNIIRPVRYWEEFKIREKATKIVKDETGDFSNSVQITETGLQTLVDLTAYELQGKRMDLYETYFCTFPMCLLQTYFLLQSYLQFKLCDIGDLSRVCTILATVFQAARCTAEYELVKSDYETAIHFLTFYKTENAIPMRTGDAGGRSWTGFLDLLQHFATTLLRFYVAVYLMAQSIVSSITYLITVYLVNLLLIALFPSTLLEIHSNAPLGVSTGISCLADRYINIFSNFSTRFARLTARPVKLLGVRFPLILLQIFQLVLPLLAVYGVSHLLPGGMLPHSPVPAEVGPSSLFNLTLTLDDCPELAEWVGINSFTRQVGDWLFNPYRVLQARFHVFNDFFQIWPVIGLLFVLQMVTGWLAAFAAAEFNLWENYPVVSGYAFWTTLFDAMVPSVSDAQMRLLPPASIVIRTLRRLMVLTLLKDREEEGIPFRNVEGSAHVGRDDDIPRFFRFTTTFGILPKSHISDSACEKLRDRLASKLTLSTRRLDELITRALGEGHVLTPYFRRMNDRMFNDRVDHEDVIVKDKKLYFLFLSHFDRKMACLSSYRVARTFQLLYIEPVKTNPIPTSPV